jgi:hypothetical protein
MITDPKIFGSVTSLRLLLSVHHIFYLIATAEIVSEPVGNPSLSAETVMSPAT